MGPGLRFVQHHLFIFRGFPNHKAKEAFNKIADGLIEAMRYAEDTGFQIPISKRSSRAGRFIGSTSRLLQNAFVSGDFTIEEIADKLDMTITDVAKKIEGRDVSLRDVSDLAWAMGYRAKVILAKDGEDW